MISYIVASHDPAIMAVNLGATLQLIDDDELVLVENAESITVAYRDGQSRATQPIRCYIHHDVEILNPPLLRGLLIEHCTQDVGMVGVIGSRTETVPWWNGDILGGITANAGFGHLNFGTSGPCYVLDGVLLATAQVVEWDTGYPGWHMYDQDSCRQMIARDLPNWCIPDGATLVRHNTYGPSATQVLPSWDEAVARYRQKWGSIDA